LEQFEYTNIISGAISNIGAVDS